VKEGPEELAPDTPDWPVLSKVDSPVLSLLSSPTLATDDNGDIALSTLSTSAEPAIGLFNEWSVTGEDRSK
jgi:hypothetical protein